MNEFQNRINLQRKILRLVNAKIQFDEPLASLSKSCIERWYSVNSGIRADTFGLLLNISEQTMFLATKSQEQITEEYSNMSMYVFEKLEELEGNISSFYKK